MNRVLVGRLQRFYIERWGTVPQMNCSAVAFEWLQTSNVVRLTWRKSHSSANTLYCYLVYQCVCLLNATSDFVSPDLPLRNNIT